MTERMLTVRDVATAARVSEKTVRKWLKEGRLRGVMLGGTKIGWRINEADLQRFLRGSQGSALS
jgi:excisionase family DNA binding protein